MEATIKMLIYGGPGSGKTSFLASGINDPRFSPGIILDFEKGLGSIRSRVNRLNDPSEVGQKMVPGKIDSISISNWDDLNEIFPLIIDTYKFVAIDSLSEAAYVNLSNLVKTAADQGRSSGKKHDEDVPELQDYHKALIRMRRFVRAFRDLPDVHVVMTCSLGVGVNPRTKTGQQQPGLQNSLILEIPHMLETVCCLDVLEDETREFIFSPTPDTIAKDRSEGQVLKDGMINATLTAILDRMEGVQHD